MQNNMPMLKDMYWKGYTPIERHKAIYEISAIIDKFGFIVDFHMFSDIEIAINIEVSGIHLKNLFNALSAYMEMDDEDLKDIDTKMEFTINFNVTFRDGTGNLRIEIPDIPG